MSTQARFRLQIKPSRIAGEGVFATEDIPWGVKIVEFSGALIDDDEAERRAKAGASAIMELGDGMNIDGFDGGGVAAMINHRRRAPNCCLLRDKGKIWIIAGVEGVNAGEELTYDYGTDYYPRSRRKAPRAQIRVASKATRASHQPLRCSCMGHPGQHRLIEAIS